MNGLQYSREFLCLSTNIDTNINLWPFKIHTNPDQEYLVANCKPRSKKSTYRIWNLEFWQMTKNIEAPWLESEETLLDICQRFSVNITGIIESICELVDNSRTSNNVRAKFLMGWSMLCTFLRSGMWILCYEFSMHSDFRSSITVSKLAAQMFICINGPPALVRVLRKWLMRHRSTLDNQSPKMKPQEITDLAFPQKLFC